ncbi:MG2 domain protein [Maioricimonas rarisocia]|uniref:MG2 domain protein n=1 Tax=Maioricimonas rarisocia TaxID=2528026 RepID=A0A517Z8V1_9PLAN|nr:MG2 domain-containing protein [Maioricimonas rarisocia]QDU38879.1 MG2 domain protein [Maioricimonas rarisocia]
MSLRILLPVCVTLFAGALLLMADDPSKSDQRTAAERLFKDGNYTEAYDTYRKLAVDRATAGEQAANDLEQAVQCLQNLNRLGEFDELLDDALAAHEDDWQVWREAAREIARINHHGFIVAGEFERGQRRGGGQYVQSFERDRTQSIQWMETARQKLPGDLAAEQKANFFMEFAGLLMNGRQGNGAWRLQDLTSLEELPDFEEGYRGWGWSPAQGAPVDADGNPIYYHIPASFDKAANDGERWRWCLEQVAVHRPSRRNEVDYEFASFLHQQFGVQTAAQRGIILPRGDLDGDDDQADESSVYAVRTLSEDETIANLASGIKRFTLPDEFNFIAICRRLAEADDSYAERSLTMLANIFANRQQYPKAAKQWREIIERFGDNRNSKKQQLDQIVGNWGQFEAVESQAAGAGTDVEYRFRNGTEVAFEAYEIKVSQLLDDVKAYLKSRPAQVDWNKLQIDRIGWQIVQQNETKYRGERVAQWTTELDPRPDHLDRRITVSTPLRKAGAYLVIAKMKDGNTSRIVLWLNDTALVRKPLSDKSLYYVADAVTGAPIEKANVELFGWRQERVPNTRRDYRVITRNFAEFTDENGLVQADVKSLDPQFQWMAIARTDSGRLAYLGFTGIWYGHYARQKYEQTKVFTITDRPVYRPAQTVKFKFWVREVRYDVPDRSRFANRTFTVKIHDPEGTEVFSDAIETDEYGGLLGEFPLSEDAKLGQYGIVLEPQNGIHGGGNFRVEEYKKPEFEVLVEAPGKPVMLGETVTAKVQAKYYFGAPVTNATVNIKVERHSHDGRWYPYAPWDWLYGEGYWWFQPNMDWYPGFTRWGCLAPTPPWWGHRQDPPELVLQQDVSISADGTAEIEIDTSLAKALHGDQDHEYKITAEVTDASRRTIVGNGSVLVAREPFKVFAWTDRGHYRVGQTIHTRFQARTLDGRGVEGTGTLKLLKVTYDDDGTPSEQVAQEWDLATDADGSAEQEITANEAGQYRLSYTVTDDEGHTVEGGYLFVIRGEGFDGSEFRFNDLELITDRKDYKPGESIELLINTNRVGSTVLLFLRPENGTYAGPPRVLKLDGKSRVVDVQVATADMPNFYIEAVTIAHGDVHTVVREVVVPPEQRVLNVEVLPSKDEYLPGEKARVRVKLTDASGEPFVGSMVMSVYDRAVEYISGGSNVAEIREFFWKWRRNHNPRTEDNLSRWFGPLLKQGETAMHNLGVFGGMVADQDVGEKSDVADKRLETLQSRRRGRGMDYGMSAPQAAQPMSAPADGLMGESGAIGGGGEGGGGEMVQPTVRTRFADTAFWKGNLTTNRKGIARVNFDMPENLTGWKIRTWAMGHGTRVGEGTAEVVTSKNLIVRLQAPRFFVERDEVVLSAVVHNYLDEDKQARVELNLDGGTLVPLKTSGLASGGIPGQVDTSAPWYREVTVPADGEVRVDWRVKVVSPGEATVTMKALTDEESDAMQMTFPVFVHGMLKTESYSGVVRIGEEAGRLDLDVPSERKPEQSRLEIRYSPTLAGAMVDALPYLVEYPYGCTEQTLNRFLPTVITQNILQRMNLDLAAIREKRTNLNAQEIGEDSERAAQWKRYDRNPVFDEAEVARMVKQGVQDLTAMQLSDGGWGWFSGYGEHSWPHTTAVVVHGLQIAQQNDIALVPGVLDRGVEWLKQYQQKQIELLQEGDRRRDGGEKRKKPYKNHADNTDAFVFMVLVDAGQVDETMQQYLYRDRTHLSLYAKGMFGLALDAIGADEQRDMLIRNIDQFLVVDDENQTAYLDTPNGGYWWYWYGDSIEANAYYLKLLTRVNAKDPKAAGLVKYLLNNRKHATYWKSTRDTAICIEAMAEYLVASGEAEPHMLVEVWMDGELKQSVEITPDVLFTFDNSFVIEGTDIEDGRHVVELRRRSLNGGEAGPLYYNAYLTNFTTEDFITKAGLEVKVQRKFYRLTQREDATEVVRGASGQIIDQQALKYDREELPNLASVKSGDLIEIELEIDSKNDYEYVVFEDMKAAGCEPVTLQSGYTKGGLGAYVEFRDEKVSFFMRQLARGKHSVSYRLRAEIPGQFSALPTKAYAMYAPELRGNSDEMKLKIVDTEPAH